MIDMMDYKLQLKRNSNLFMNKEDALNALQNQFNSAGVKDGELIIARYKNNDNIKTIFGITSTQDTAGQKYTIFDPDAIPSEVAKKFNDLIGGELVDNYDTIKKIINALLIINGDDNTEGSIAKALADAKADSLSKIQSLDKDDRVIPHNFVTEVSEVDGIISVKRAEVTSNNRTIGINSDDDGNVDLNVNLVLTYDKANKNISLKSNGITPTVLGTIDVTDFIADGILDTVTWKNDNSSTGILVFTFSVANGDAEHPVKSSFEVDLTQFIKPYNAGNGISLTEQSFNVKVKEGDKYLEVTTNGLASKGIDDTITNAINALTVTEQAEDNKYINKITQTNGKISVALKQVEAKEVKLEQISEAGTNGVKLSATTAQEGIAELFAKMLDNEEVSAETIHKIKTILGIEGEELKYTPKTDDIIIGSATSYSDADAMLAKSLKETQDNAITVSAGNGININGGTHKVISAKVAFNDSLITIGANGIQTKDDAIIDCGSF